MRPYDAYKQQRLPSPPRIDLIIALYRKAIERLQRAGVCLAAQRHDEARTLLAETKLVLATLAAGMAGTSDPGAINFLRLFEFVSHQTTLATVEALAAAEKVLTSLLEIFTSVRDQAAALELQGKIPSLDQEHQIQVSA